MKVCVIGGGLMGSTIAYELAKRGTVVDVYEASPTIGGLAGRLTLNDGSNVDRFYHVVHPDDTYLLSLLEELGLLEKIRRFKETRGLLYQQAIYPSNAYMDVLRFEPLNVVDRLRLFYTVVSTLQSSNSKVLDSVSVVDWLIKQGGEKAFQTLWIPLLRIKFDGPYSDVPASFLLTHFRRLTIFSKNVMNRGQAGLLDGGYTRLINRMFHAIRGAGGSIYLDTPVHEIVIEEGRATGIRLMEETRPYDAVIVTMQTPIFQRLIPAASREYHEFLNNTEYIGIICPLVILNQPFFSVSFTVISERQIPFSSVVELEDHPNVNGSGRYLVYLPRFTMATSPYTRKSDDEIRNEWIHWMKIIRPGFQESWIQQFIISRQRYVEPVHKLGWAGRIPSVETPVKNLYLANNSQIYPAQNLGNSVVHFAQTNANLIHERLSEIYHLPGEGE